MVKRITIPCNFPSGRFDIDFFVGRPRPEDHPIQYQSTWLSRERGGTVPGNIMDAIAKLRDLAKKNNVAFEDLCLYAIVKAKRGKIEESRVEEKGEEAKKREKGEQEEKIRKAFNEFEKGKTGEIG